MTSRGLSWSRTPAVLAGTIMSFASPAHALGAKEPLIVTVLPDPDPGFASGQVKKSSSDQWIEAQEQLNSNAALLSLKRAIGEAVLSQKQRTEAQCAKGEGAKESNEERFAWAANCRYRRY